MRARDDDLDLNYYRLAYDIWRDRPGLAQTLASAMADLIAENERHRQTLLELNRRFKTLAANQGLRETIDGPENYFDLIRTRLFEPLDPP